MPRSLFQRFWELLGGDVQVCRLDDASTHRVVKVLYEPAELSTDLESRGWDARIRGTRWLIDGDAAIRTGTVPGP